MRTPARIGLTAIAAMLALQPGGARGDGDLFLAGFEPVALEDLALTRAATPLALVDALVAPPEEVLPLRLLALTMDGAGDGLLVSVELRGYLDDAVRGENLRLRMVRDGADWLLTAVGRQSVCQRGPAAGGPARICP